jgi:hypothetical protein
MGFTEDTIRTCASSRVREEAEILTRRQFPIFPLARLIPEILTDIRRDYRGGFPIPTQYILMKRKSLCGLPVAAILAAGAFSIVRAATPLPVWYGEPNTTRQGYEFTNNSITPSATILENSYGLPITTITLGGFADGWQDPANPIELSGVLANGAWDLGTAGAITAQCRVAANAPLPGSYYRIDFMVYAVAYRGITALPLFDSLGLTGRDLVLTQTTVAEDPIFPGATWEGRTWTGYFDHVTTNIVGFAIKSPANNTSVIDTYEIFTKATLVPEPSAILLWFMPVAAWSLRRRRS